MWDSSVFSPLSPAIHLYPLKLPLPLLLMLHFLFNFYKYFKKFFKKYDLYTYLYIYHSVVHPKFPFGIILLLIEESLSAFMLDAGDHFSTFLHPRMSLFSHHLEDMNLSMEFWAAVLSSVYHLMTWLMGNPQPSDPTLYT